jgi:hypothetical protein
MATDEESSEQKKVRQVTGHCPKCGPNRYANVVGHHNVLDSDELTGVWAESDYYMLSCGGCRTVYFKEVFTFSEDWSHSRHPITGQEMMEYDERVTYWPSPVQRKRPDWLEEVQLIDSTLFNILIEVFKSLDTDARILGAIGVRTAFDRTSELLDVDPGLRFDRKLDMLTERGKIGLGEKSHLATLTDAGSAAAHRAWTPSLEELSTMMNILESFIYRTLLLDRQVSKMKPSIPTRPPRRKKSDS